MPLIFNTEEAGSACPAVLAFVGDHAQLGVFERHEIDLELGDFRENA